MSPIAVRYQATLAAAMRCAAAGSGSTDQGRSGCDLLHDNPGDATHGLTLDRHHRVGELWMISRLIGREDTLDELDVDERHRGPSDKN